MSAARLFIFMAALLLTGGIVEFLAFLRAPVGYQDKDGFHSGVPQNTSENSSQDTFLG